MAVWGYGIRKKRDKEISTDCIIYAINIDRIPIVMDLWKKIALHCKSPALSSSVASPTI